VKTLTLFFVGLFVSGSLAFNMQAYEYHYMTCWVTKMCAVNCRGISLSVVIGKGREACKICRPPGAVENREIKSDNFFRTKLIRTA
jgi:hypothetical protein